MKRNTERVRKPSYLDFDRSSYPWQSHIDYSAEPEKYRVGRGEQGVLICEPYKSEILPFWRFKTPEAAAKSARKILSLFETYLDEDDFVGADLARKFLQMGYTRARRYANYKSGKKYDDKFQELERGTGDATKVESANYFYEAWRKAEANEKYADLKDIWISTFG